jgi:hypothetical protein
MSLILNIFRFRKYFIRVLMFLPRVVCGKNLGKDWECQKTNNTMQLKQMNGVSNFNSHVSNSPDVLGGAGSSGRRISHTGLARSRSMTYSPSENHKRDVTCQNNYGNSLLPQRQSRLTSSCVSKQFKYDKDTSRLLKILILDIKCIHIIVS